MADLHEALDVCPMQRTRQVSVPAWRSQQLLEATTGFWHEKLAEAGVLTLVAICSDPGLHGAPCSCPEVLTSCLSGPESRLGTKVRGCDLFVDFESRAPDSPAWKRRRRSLAIPGAPRRTCACAPDSLSFRVRSRLDKCASEVARKQGGHDASS